MTVTEGVTDGAGPVLSVLDSRLGPKTGWNRGVDVEMQREGSKRSKRRNRVDHTRLDSPQNDPSAPFLSAWRSEMD